MTIEDCFYHVPKKHEQLFGRGNFTVGLNGNTLVVPAIEFRDEEEETFYIKLQLRNHHIVSYRRGRSGPCVVVTDDTLTITEISLRENASSQKIEITKPTGFVKIDFGKNKGFVLNLVQSGNGPLSVRGQFIASL